MPGLVEGRVHSWKFTVMWMGSLCPADSGSHGASCILVTGLLLRDGWPHNHNTLSAHWCGSDSKESVCNAVDLGSIPGSGRCPGEGNGYPLQYSCLENSMDTGAWRAAVHGVTKSRMRLSS